MVEIIRKYLIIVVFLLVWIDSSELNGQLYKGFLRNYSLGFNNIYIHASAHWMKPPDKEYFKPLLVWYDNERHAQKDSIFFDTFLLIQSAVKVGKSEYRLTQAGKNQVHAQLSHWIHYLDVNLFDQNLYLVELNAAVDDLALSRTVNVIIPIPYPDHAQKDFNDMMDFPGNILPSNCDFSIMENRKAAIELYLSMVKEKWNKFRYKSNLKLVGFYWLQEAKFQDWPNGIQDDSKLLLEVSKSIHSFKLDENDRQLYKFVLIPSLPNSIGIKTKPGMTIDDYEETGLDAILIQPGLTYQYNDNPYVLMYFKQYANMDSVALKCLKEGFGISLEYHPPQELFEDKNLTRDKIYTAVQLYISQLKEGYFYGYAEPQVMKSFWINPFTGKYGLSKLFQGVHTDLFDSRIQRLVYDITYCFVKGKHCPLLYHELEKEILIDN